MTGYGEARREAGHLSLAVEVRSVNNRYLKVQTKCPNAYAPLESEIERVVREAVSRGTLSISIHASLRDASAGFAIDQGALKGYWKQLHEAAHALGAAVPQDIGRLIDLPGVVKEAMDELASPESDWPALEATLKAALANLHTFRVTEGASMGVELRSNCAEIGTRLAVVTELAPTVLAGYRQKLLDRVRDALTGSEAKVTEADLLREVSVFADRCDIAEEIARLGAHLTQFIAFLDHETSLGRKLEFLSQEMFREVNTLGAKANNVEIAHAVVDMKSSIEKIREILQNVE